MGSKKKRSAEDVAGAILNLRELVSQARVKLNQADIMGSQIAEALGDDDLAVLVEEATCIADNSLAKACSAARAARAIDESLTTLEAAFGRLAADFADPRM